MACWTVVIFSASSSGISVSNSSSSAITSSTVSSESAPRSSTNEESFLISASFTPSCSAMIFLTACSMFSAIDFSFPKRGRILRHVHAAVDVQHVPGNVAGGGRREVRDRGGDLGRSAQPAERNLREQRALLLFAQRPCHVGVDEPRRHAVHRDVAARAIATARAPEGPGGRLGGGVVGLAGGAGGPRGPA